MSETAMIQIARPAPPAIAQELMPVVSEARAFLVRTVDDHAQALERARRLRQGEKAIAEAFEPSRRAADAAKREILALRDALVGPIAEARAAYDRSAQVYEAKEREKAAVEERRLQEEARKREEERALQDAIAAEAEGDTAAAEAILEEPIAVPQVRVAPAVAQVEGVSGRKTWSAEVHDVRACLRFMLDAPEWEQALLRCKDVLETALRPLATAQRGSLRIPGVRVVETQHRAYR